MLQIEINAGDLELTKGSNEILEDVILELAKTEPRKIEEKLKEGGHILSKIEQRLN